MASMNSVTHSVRWLMRTPLCRVGRASGLRETCHYRRTETATTSDLPGRESRLKEMDDVHTPQESATGPVYYRIPTSG